MDKKVRIRTNDLNMINEKKIGVLELTHFEAFGINPLSDQLLGASATKFKLFSFMEMTPLGERVIADDFAEEQQKLSQQLVIKLIEPIILTGLWVVFTNQRSVIVLDKQLIISQILSIEDQPSRILFAQRTEEIYFMKSDFKSIKCNKLDYSDYYCSHQEANRIGPVLSDPTQIQEGFRISLYKSKPSIILRTHCMSWRLNEELCLLAISTESGEVMVYNTNTHELRRVVHKGEVSETKRPYVIDWSQEFLFFANDEIICIYDALRDSEIRRQQNLYGTLGFPIDMYISEHSTSGGLIFITSEYQIINYSLDRNMSLSIKNFFQEKNVEDISAIEAVNYSKSKASKSKHQNTGINTTPREKVMNYAQYVYSRCLVMSPNSKNLIVLAAFKQIAIFEIKSAVTLLTINESKGRNVYFCDQRTCSQSNVYVMQKNLEHFFVMNSELEIFNFIKGKQFNGILISRNFEDYDRIDRFIHSIREVDDKTTYFIHKKLLIIVVIFKKKIFAIDLKGFKIIEGSHDLDCFNKVTIIKRVNGAEGVAESPLLTFLKDDAILFYELNFYSTQIKFLKNVKVGNSKIVEVHHDPDQGRFIIVSNDSKIMILKDRFFFLDFQFSFIYSNATTAIFLNNNELIGGFESGDLEYRNLASSKLSTGYKIFSFSTTPIQMIRVLRKEEEGVKTTVFGALSAKYLLTIWNLEDSILLKIINVPDNLLDFGFYEIDGLVEIVGMTEFCLLFYSMAHLGVYKELASPECRLNFFSLVDSKNRRFNSSKREQKRYQDLLQKKNQAYMETILNIKKEHLDQAELKKLNFKNVLFKPVLYQTLYDEFGHMSHPSYYIDFLRISSESREMKGVIGVADSILRDELFNKDVLIKRVLSADKRT